MKKRVGLFGGTFNPIHFGHLNLAIEIKEKCQLDEIWFIPALISPFRSEEPPLLGNHRLKMLSLALEHIQEFKVIEHELNRLGPSYTIDTLRELVENKNFNFHLLLGEDLLLNLKKWKEAEEIIKLVPLLVGYRHGVEIKSKIESLHMSSSMEEAVKKGLIETSIMEISATNIRFRLKNKLYCGHLVPWKVLDYIYENQLYFSSES